MTRIVLNIVTTIASIAATVIFMYLVFFHLFMHLGDWTFKYFQKFLMTQLKPIDHILIQCFPLVYIYPIVRYKLRYWSEMVRMTVMGIGTTFLAIIAGITIGIFTWTNDQSSPLLPEYLLEQPFGNYWTIFIAIGIAIPIALLILKNRKKDREKSTID